MLDRDIEPALSITPSPWIGTYAGEGGGGLYPLTGTTGSLAVGPPYRDASNASFGVHAPRFDVHYLVDEQDIGRLGVHRRTSSGWHRLGSVATEGAAPCHVAIDATQSCIAVANYGNGGIAVYRLDQNSGLPIIPPMVYVNDGRGPDPDRQESPHAHWVGFSPDNRTLYATDLGTDAVLAFAFDAQSGTIGAVRTAFRAAPGSGPRHMLFHDRQPGLAYLVCELDSTLVTLDIDGTGNGSVELRERATLPTIPAGWSGHSILAHIGANAAGDRLYVSNRGHDSIAVFALDARGDATPIQHITSGGVSPRFFMILEEEARMMVVHERDHRVTMLDILADGTLASTGNAITVPGAAFALIG